MHPVAVLSSLTAILAVVRASPTLSQNKGTCNADNCYRALFPCRPGLESAWQAATAFCSAINTGPTPTSNYPPSATLACGNFPARYVSACRCGPTCTPTALSTPTCQPQGPPRDIPPNALLHFKDFECGGLGEWNLQIADAACTGAIVTPGLRTDRAFEARLVGPVGTPDPIEGTSLRITTVVNAAANVPVMVRFWLGWRGPVSPSPELWDGLTLSINETPIFFRTPEDDGNSKDDWRGFEVQYIPKTDRLVVSFGFILRNPGSSILLDTVSVSWLR